MSLKSMSAKTVNALNNMFKITKTSGLGTLIKERGVVFIKALVADEVAAGVATVDTGLVWTKFAGVMVVAADGTVRAVTNVKAVAGAGNTTKIAITATNVAATDTVKVILV